MISINGPQELYHFLVGHALVGINPEAQQLVLCIDSLSRMCMCDPAPLKQNKFNQCKSLYTNFVQKCLGSASLLLNKAGTNRIVFLLNGQQIGSICR